MTPSAKRIRLDNDTTEGFSAAREALAQELLVASSSDSKRAKELVGQGVDAWYADEAGWTVLHHAVCAYFRSQFLRCSGLIRAHSEGRPRSRALLAP